MEPFGFSSTVQFEPVGMFGTVTEPVTAGALIVMSKGLPATGTLLQVRSNRKVPEP